MQIRFLAAGTGFPPNGGTGVIYEHANRLAEKGHSVTIHHMLLFPGDSLKTTLYYLRLYIWFLLRKSLFPKTGLNSRLRIRRNLKAKLDDVGPDEIVIATYYKTHLLLSDKLLRQNKCFYLIQGVDLDEDSPLLHSQWSSGSQNIVISRWLKELVDRHSDRPAVIVPNAIDQSFFAENTESKRPSKFTVLFNSTLIAKKGAIDVIEALNSLDRDVAIVAFGRTDPGQLGLKKPYKFHGLVPHDRLRDLYRQAHAYISASHNEGWGLTLAEATACGTAVIASDAKGHFEFLAAEGSALFFPVGDVEALRQQIVALVDNPAAIEGLVANAWRDLAPFTWASAANAMELALSSAQGVAGE